MALVSRRLEPLQAIEAEIKYAGGTAFSVAADAGSSLAAAFTNVASSAFWDLEWSIRFQYLSSPKPKSVPCSLGHRPHGHASQAADALAGKEADVKTAFQAIVKEFGAYPEVLVYNAGPGHFVWPPPPLLEIPVDAFGKTFDAGVTGALAWIQQVASCHQTCYIANLKCRKLTVTLP